MNFDNPNYLDRSNSKLLELEVTYSKHPMNKLSMWREWANTIDIKNFRGDPYYLGQLRFGMEEKGYYDAYEYVKQIDKLNLLNKLTEDDKYGIVKFFKDGKLITRDLLDSIIEINFLEKNLNISRLTNFNVLDIGAGYGRFAHRLVKSFDCARVACIDCVPISTFICEYYLHMRDVSRVAKTIRLDEIENLKAGQFVLASNIHSWPECPLESIKSWLNLIVKLEIPYLFIVGHHEPLESFEGGGKILNFYNEIIKVGFKEKVFSYKIGDNKKWFNKEFVGFTPYYLFEKS